MLVIGTTLVVMNEHLRPIERRIVQLTDDGIDSEEIGRRFRRSEAYVDRIRVWAQIPGRSTIERDEVLRPIERRVLDLRSEGVHRDEIGRRFMKSADQIRRIEGFAHWKLGNALLTS